MRTEFERVKMNAKVNVNYTCLDLLENRLPPASEKKDFKNDPMYCNAMEEAQGD